MGGVYVPEALAAEMDEEQVCARTDRCRASRRTVARAPSREAQLRQMEIGPKTGFFGPIPAEKGGNWPKIQTADRAVTAAKSL